MATKRTIKEAQDANRAKLEAMGIEAICDLMREGTVYRDVAARVGVSLSALWRWIYVDDERAAKVRTALTESADACDALAEAVLMDISPEASKAEVARARELAHHYRWRAAKRNPKTFGERQQVDLDATLDIPLSEEQVDAQLIALAKAAKKTPRA